MFSCAPGCPHAGRVTSLCLPASAAGELATLGERRADAAWGEAMALRVAGLLRALETGLGRPKGGAPNPLFAQYVQGLEHRAAGADPVCGHPRADCCPRPSCPHSPPLAKTLAEPFAGVSQATAAALQGAVTDWEYSVNAVHHYKVRCRPRSHPSPSPLPMPQSDVGCALLRKCCRRAACGLKSRCRTVRPKTHPRPQPWEKRLTLRLWAVQVCA